MTQSFVMPDKVVAEWKRQGSKAGGIIHNNGFGWATKEDVLNYANGKNIKVIRFAVCKVHLYHTSPPGGKGGLITTKAPGSYFYWLENYKGNEYTPRWIGVIDYKSMDTSASNSSAPGTDGDSGDGGVDSGGDGTNQAQSAERNPLLSGDRTFAEIIKEICDATDTLFIVKKSTILITDVTTLYTRAKHMEDNDQFKKRNTVKLWQMEDESLKVNINQYAMYNTVYVKYKNGVIKEYHEELVRIFGEKKIEYKEPKSDKTAAEIKAKAYLAHHVRDFGMTIELSALHHAGYDIGDLLWITNPLTNVKREELYFVSGVKTEISAEDGILKSSLELKFGPANPDSPQIDEVGFSGTVDMDSGAIDKAIDEVVDMFKGVTYGGSGGGNASGCTGRGHCDCYGTTYTIWDELTKRGIPCRIWTKEGAGAYSGTHRVCTYKKDGKWVNFPHDRLPSGLGWGRDPGKGLCMIKDENGKQHCSKPTTM